MRGHYRRVVINLINLRTQVIIERWNSIASDTEVDIVMAAIVGAAGLPSCMAAARARLLANKEALVVGGQVFMKVAIG
jgi:1-deoxy-D-xylulose-5-phosphate reductoisomerase